VASVSALWTFTSAHQVFLKPKNKNKLLATYRE
jgi:hypothetical protein